MNARKNFKFAYSAVRLHASSLPCGVYGIIGTDGEGRERVSDFFVYEAGMAAQSATSQTGNFMTGDQAAADAAVCAFSSRVLSDHRQTLRQKDARSVAWCDDGAYDYT